MLKCDYYNKNVHIVLFYYIRKSNESKNEYPSFHFYKKYLKNKMINMDTTS